LYNLLLPFKPLQSSVHRGCSSLGRAVGSQSAGTGIEFLLLHMFLKDGSGLFFLLITLLIAHVVEKRGVSSVVEQLVAAR
jgi:hypothetical protein